MALPTAVISDFFEITLNSCAATRSRFIKIKILLPNTAALFGVMPQAEIRNKIAESAMLLTTIVIADNRKRTHTCAWFLIVLDV